MVNPAEFFREVGVGARDREPVVPLVASYELELDTENFIIDAWRSIRSAIENLRG